MEYTALFLYAVTCLSDTGIPRNSLYLRLHQKDCFIYAILLSYRKNKDYTRESTSL